MLLTPLQALPRSFTSRTTPALQHTIRAFSSTPSPSQKLRIGYIPEHFLTPLHFAHDKYGLSSHAELIPFPRGTGTLIDAFHTRSIDVGIGLTESFIVGLTNTFGGSDWSDKPYHLVGQYTTTPLTWAISTGRLRSDITYVEELRGTAVGVSRLGSGSHVMASVLAATHGWTDGLTAQRNKFVECGPFAALRTAVTEGKADWFMWEHYTTKKYWDNGELKRLGQLETPWPAWHIAAVGAHADERVARHLLPALAKGVRHFQENKEGAVRWITENMEYSLEDAEAWYEGVAFASRKQMGVLDETVMTNAVGILEKAGAVGDRRILETSALQAGDAERYLMSGSEEFEEESALLRKR